MLDELAQIVRGIPRGKVATYGDVGQALSQPVSGFIVGRMMARLTEETPWWRVIARDGRLPISKKDPGLESIQATRLRAEGVEVVNGIVSIEVCRYVP